MSGDSMTDCDHDINLESIASPSGAEGRAAVPAS